tara:strand:+ start:26538 stop:26783 length:246 start_codon:yes stop_codon:yes gene_type:complete
MSSTIIKSLNSNNQYQNQVVIQITKKQLVIFFRFVGLLLFSVINIFAISSKSVLLKELVIAQIILFMVLFIKYSKSNTVLK